MDAFVPLKFLFLLKRFFLLILINPIHMKRRKHRIFVHSGVFRGLEKNELFDLVLFDVGVVFAVELEVVVRKVEFQFSSFFVFEVGFRWLFSLVILRLEVI